MEVIAEMLVQIKNNLSKRTSVLLASYAVSSLLLVIFLIVKYGFFLDFKANLLVAIFSMVSLLFLCLGFYGINSKHAEGKIKGKAHGFGSLQVIKTIAASLAASVGVFITLIVISLFLFGFEATKIFTENMYVMLSIFFLGSVPYIYLRIR